MPALPAPSRRLLGLALALGVLAAGAAVRVATWPWVYGHEEVRFSSDGDALYHVLQAERLERDGLAAVWRDPRLNFPAGSDVPWPPLFDALLASAGRVAAGGGAPDRATLEAASMWVPVVAGLLTLLLMAWLARALLGGRRWLDAALVLALLPSHAAITSLGRPDHHALEPLLLALVVVAAGWIAADRPGRAPEALLGVAAALAFWNWNGSALYLGLVAGFAGAWHALASPGDPAPGRAAARLARGFALGAVILAASVALLGPGRAALRAGLSGLTMLQPLLMAGTAAACALVAWARRARPAAPAWERILATAGALLLPPLVLVLVPWTGEGVGRGLAMLGASGWYRGIGEFQPLLPSGNRTYTEDVADLLLRNGFTILAVPAALPLLWRRWRRADVGERGPLLLAGLTLIGTLVMGWARNRFTCYLAVGEALATALLARAAADAVAARWPDRRWTAGAAWAAGAAVVALALAPLAPGLPGATWFTPHLARYTDIAPLVRLAARVPVQPGREAVMCSWSDGHDVLYFSPRPVVSSPFGVEGGAGALEDDAAFHFAGTQEQAEDLLAARRVGLVLVSRPVEEGQSLIDFAPPGQRNVLSLTHDADGKPRLLLSPAFNRLVAHRLWLWDGMQGDLNGRLTTGSTPTLDAFRLLGESSTPSLWHAVSAPLFKLFQWVPGLRLRVRARPGTAIEATTRLRTNAGRSEAWSVQATARLDGWAELRLPYATGLNGEVVAAPWQVTDGQRTLEVPALERDVLLGGQLDVSLGR